MATSREVLMESVARLKSLFYRAPIPRSTALDPDEDHADPWYCLGPETRIPLLDGTSPTIAELAERREPFWLYAYDHTVGDVVAALGRDARCTKKQDDWYEVLLDNGERVVCNATHPFMLRDGTYRKAAELAPYTSLMPLYTKKRPIQLSFSKGFNPKYAGSEYQHFFSFAQAEWVPVHWMVAEQILRQQPEGTHCHHVDFDRFNNDPANLRYVAPEEHEELHRAHCTRIGREVWTDPEKREKTILSHQAFRSWQNLSPEALAGRLRLQPLRSKLGWEKRKARLNHYVVSVTRIGSGSVYDLTVDGYNNFAVGAGVFVHNSWLRAQRELPWDRRLRYRDYDDISNDVFGGSAIEIYCLAGSTQVPLLSGEVVAIRDLVGRAGFWIYSVKPNGYVVPGWGHSARRTGEKAVTVDVTLDNGEVVRCTPNHRFMLRDGSYCEAQDLRTGDSLMPLYRRSVNGYEEVLDLAQNHKVVSVVQAGEEDVYDITVEGLHNFALAAGVFVHNSEEACQFNREHDATIWIKTANKVIGEAWQLFVERIKLEDHIHAVAMDLAKYGDDFQKCLYNKDAPPDSAEAGLLGVQYVDPNMVERDHDEFGRLTGFRTLDPSQLGMQTIYSREDRGPKKPGREWKPYDFSHFRILGRKDIRRYEGGKYGFSMLESSRRIWKQLQTLEDSLQLYRLHRSGGQRIFYIDVGQMGFVEALNVARLYKKTYNVKSFVNPNSGEYVARFAPHCLTGETKISLLDGRECSIDELNKEFGHSGFWVYSTDEQGRVRPGYAHSLHKTGIQAQLVEVQLDNGGTVRCTPNHKFLLRDGSYCEAQKLEAGTSLMPLYRRVDDKGYEEFYDPYIEYWRKTHRRVNDEFVPRERDAKGRFTRGWVDHHVNFNKRDNSPVNLARISFVEHRRIHMEHCRETFGRFWADSEWRARQGDKFRDWYATPKGQEYAEQLRKDFVVFGKMSGAKYITEYNKSQAHRDKARETNVLGRLWTANPEKMRAACLQAWSRNGLKRSLSERNSKGQFVNHQVVSIRFLEEQADVYDLTVDKYHNFALSAGVFVSNSWNSDIFWPIRSIGGKESGSRIELLGHGVDVSSIADIDYFRRKMFAALKVPAAYLGFEADLPSGIGANAARTLSQQDVRFARSVKKLQRALIQGYSMLFRMHLALLELPTESENFDLVMTVVSILEEQDRLEAMAIALEIADRFSLTGASLGLDRGLLARYILINVLFIPQDELDALGWDIEIARAEPMLGGMMGPPSNMPPLRTGGVLGAGSLGAGRAPGGTRSSAGPVREHVNRAIQQLLERDPGLRREVQSFIQRIEGSENE